MFGDLDVAEDPSVPEETLHKRKLKYLEHKKRQQKVKDRNKRKAEKLKAENPEPAVEEGSSDDSEDEYVSLLLNI